MASLAECNNFCLKGVELNLSWAELMYIFLYELNCFLNPTVRFQPSVVAIFTRAGRTRNDNGMEETESSNQGQNILVNISSPPTIKKTGAMQASHLLPTNACPKKKHRWHTLTFLRVWWSLSQEIFPATAQTCNRQCTHV